MQVTVDPKANTLTIVMNLDKPSPSTSGKTLVIASSRGCVKTGALYDGKEITLGVNAFIPKG